MRKGTVQASASDLSLASTYGFQAGDIVFRLGSKVLAAIIDNPVTHGGIYLGDGRIHDMVGFGNRTATLSTFYEESADKSVVKFIRFTGPHADLIVPRTVKNILARDFRLPTDPKPWNLFSSADDYKTATCLEYAHAQFLYAIKQISEDPAIAEATRRDVKKTYFAAGAAEPNALARPQHLSSSYPAGHPSSSAVLMALSDSGGSNIDPSVFENRFEGKVEYKNYGPDPNSWLSYVVPPNVVVTESFDTFTYRSFADSRQYFTVIR
jgi:hypothetical protein